MRNTILRNSPEPACRTNSRIRYSCLSRLIHREVGLCVPLMVPKLAARNIHKVGALVARKRNIAELSIILAAAIGRRRSVRRGKHGLYRKCGFGGVFRLRTGRSPALSDFGSSLQGQHRNKHHKCKQQSGKHSELCLHLSCSS